MNKTWKRVFYGVIAAALIALVVLALSPDPVKVESAAAVSGPLLVTVDEDGETRARDRFLIAAPVAGRVARIDLRDGDAVTANQPVAEIWPLPLSAREREEQTAHIAAVEAGLRAAQSSAQRARADHEQKRRERARTEDLVKNRFLSPQAAEQAQVAEDISAQDLQTEQARVRAAEGPQRALGRGDPGERRGDVLGEDGDGDGRHERGRPWRDPIDVARHDASRPPPRLRQRNRRLLVHVVHVHKARRVDHVERQRGRVELQPGIAVPEHDALASLLVHQDDGVLVAPLPHDEVREVDAEALEGGADARAVLVGAGHPDVRRPQAESRAGAERGRHLPAAGDHLARDRQLRAGTLGCGRGRQ